MAERFTQDHGPPHIDGEAHRIDHAGELHQRAVAHEFDHSTVVLGSLGLDQFSAKCFERRERVNLVGSQGGYNRQCRQRGWWSACARAVALNASLLN